MAAEIKTIPPHPVHWPEGELQTRVEGIICEALPVR